MATVSSGLRCWCSATTTRTCTSISPRTWRLPRAGRGSRNPHTGSRSPAASAGIIWASTCAFPVTTSPPRASRKLSSSPGSRTISASRSRRFRAPARVRPRMAGRFWALVQHDRPATAFFLKNSAKRWRQGRFCCFY